MLHSFSHITYLFCPWRFLLCLLMKRTPSLYCTCVCTRSHKCGPYGRTAGDCPSARAFTSSQAPRHLWLHPKAELLVGLAPGSPHMSRLERTTMKETTKSHLVPLFYPQQCHNLLLVFATIEPGRVGLTNRNLSIAQLTLKVISPRIRKTLLQIQSMFYQFDYLQIHCYLSVTRWDKFCSTAVAAMCWDAIEYIKQTDLPLSN